VHVKFEAHCSPGQQFEHDAPGPPQPPPSGGGPPESGGGQHELFCFPQLSTQGPPQPLGVQPASGGGGGQQELFCCPQLSTQDPPQPLG
jgi:hypothetical protein